jgi:hypothetical protein
MARRPKAAKRQPKRNPHLLPGEYKRIKTVTITVDNLMAGILGLKADVEAQLAGQANVDVHYIVTTRRIDGAWTYFIEIKGEVFRLPGAVMDQMMRHREAIITEAARERGVEQAHRRLAAKARADQDEAAADAEAEAERARDLGGQ